MSLMLKLPLKKIILLHKFKADLHSVLIEMRKLFKRGVNIFLPD